MFTRVLVPTDFSAPSDAVLEYARVVAGTFGASLHVLHVIDAPTVTSPLCTAAGYIDESPVVQAEVSEDARIRFDHRINANDRIRNAATTEIMPGTPARAIVTYAAEKKMDLIVMGTHGRSGMAHLLMGSLVEKVVRDAPCPVLTVREAPIAKVRVPEWVEKAGAVAVA